MFSSYKEPASCYSNQHFFDNSNQSVFQDGDNAKQPGQPVQWEYPPQHYSSAPCYSTVPHVENRQAVQSSNNTQFISQTDRKNNTTKTQDSDISHNYSNSNNIVRPTALINCQANCNACFNHTHRLPHHQNSNTDCSKYLESTATPSKDSACFSQNIDGFTNDNSVGDFATSLSKLSKFSKSGEYESNNTQSAKTNLSPVITSSKCPPVLGERHVQGTSAVNDNSSGREDSHSSRLYKPQPMTFPVRTSFTDSQSADSVRRDDMGRYSNHVPPNPSCSQWGAAGRQQGDMWFPNAPANFWMPPNAAPVPNYWYERNGEITNVTSQSMMSHACDVMRYKSDSSRHGNREKLHRVERNSELRKFSDAQSHMHEASLRSKDNYHELNYPVASDRNMSLGHNLSKNHPHIQKSKDSSKVKKVPNHYNTPNSVRNMPTTYDPTIHPFPPHGAAVEGYSDSNLHNGTGLLSHYRPKINEPFTTGIAPPPSRFGTDFSFAQSRISKSNNYLQCIDTPYIPNMPFPSDNNLTCNSVPPVPRYHTDRNHYIEGQLAKRHAPHSIVHSAKDVGEVASNLQACNRGRDNLEYGKTMQVVDTPTYAAPENSVTNGHYLYTKHPHMSQRNVQMPTFYPPFPTMRGDNNDYNMFSNNNMHPSYQELNILQHNATRNMFGIGKVVKDMHLYPGSQNQELVMQPQMHLENNCVSPEMLSRDKLKGTLNEGNCGVTNRLKYQSNQESSNAPVLDVRQYLANWDEESEDVTVDTPAAEVPISESDSVLVLDFRSFNNDTPEEPTNLSLVRPAHSDMPSIDPGEENVDTGPTVVPLPKENIQTVSADVNISSILKPVEECNKDRNNPSVESCHSSNSGYDLSSDRYPQSASQSHYSPPLKNHIKESAINRDKNNSNVPLNIKSPNNLILTDSKTSPHNTYLRSKELFVEHSPRNKELFVERSPLQSSPISLVLNKQNSNMRLIPKNKEPNSIIETFTMGTSVRTPDFQDEVELSDHALSSVSVTGEDDDNAGIFPIEEDGTSTPVVRSPLREPSKLNLNMISTHADITDMFKTDTDDNQEIVNHFDMKDMENFERNVLDKLSNVNCLDNSEVDTIKGDTCFSVVNESETSVKTSENKEMKNINKEESCLEAESDNLKMITTCLENVVVDKPTGSRVENTSPVLDTPPVNTVRSGLNSENLAEKSTEFSDSLFESTTNVLSLTDYNLSRPSCIEFGSNSNSSHSIEAMNTKFTDKKFTETFSINCSKTNSAVNEVNNCEDLSSKELLSNAEEHNRNCTVIQNTVIIKDKLAFTDTDENNIKNNSETNVALSDTFPEDTSKSKKTKFTNVANANERNFLDKCTLEIESLVKDNLGTSEDTSIIDSRNKDHIAESDSSLVKNTELLLGSQYEFDSDCVMTRQSKEKADEYEKISNNKLVTVIENSEFQSNEKIRTENNVAVNKEDIVTKNVNDNEKGTAVIKTSDDIDECEAVHENSETVIDNRNSTIISDDVMIEKESKAILVCNSVKVKKDGGDDDSLLLDSEKLNKNSLIGMHLINDENHGVDKDLINTDVFQDTCDEINDLKSKTVVSNSDQRCKINDKDTTTESALKNKKDIKTDIKKEALKMDVYEQPINASDSYDTKAAENTSNDELLKSNDELCKNDPVVNILTSDLEATSLGNSCTDFSSSNVATVLSNGKILISAGVNDAKLNKVDECFDVQAEAGHEIGENTEKTVNHYSQLETEKELQIIENVLGDIIETVSEDITRTVSEDITETVSEDITESVSADIIESVSEDITETVSEDSTRRVSEDIKTASEDITGSVSKDTETVSEGITESMSENITETVPENITRSVSEDIVTASEDITGSVSKDIMETVSEDITESVSKDITGSVSKDISDSVSEDITETVPEDSTRSVSEDIKTASEDITGSGSKDTETVSEGITESMSENITETVPENSTRSVSEDIVTASEDITGSVSKDIIETVSEDITESVSKDITGSVSKDIETVLEDITESVSEDIIKTVSECITESMSEDIIESVPESSTRSVSEDIETVSEDIIGSVSKDIIETVAEDITESVSKDITESVPEGITETVNTLSLKDGVPDIVYESQHGQRETSDSSDSINIKNQQGLNLESNENITDPGFKTNMFCKSESQKSPVTVVSNVETPENDNDCYQDKNHNVAQRMCLITEKDVEKNSDSVQNFPIDDISITNDDSVFSLISCSSTDNVENNRPEGINATFEDQSELSLLPFNSACNAENIHPNIKSSISESQLTQSSLLCDSADDVEIVHPESVSNSSDELLTCSQLQHNLVDNGENIELNGKISISADNSVYSLLSCDSDDEKIIQQEVLTNTSEDHQRCSSLPRNTIDYSEDNERDSKKKTFENCSSHLPLQSKFDSADDVKNNQPGALNNASDDFLSYSSLPHYSADNAMNHHPEGINTISEDLLSCSSSSEDDKIVQPGSLNTSKDHHSCLPHTSADHAEGLHPVDIKNISEDRSVCSTSCNSSDDVNNTQPESIDNTSEENLAYSSLPFYSTDRAENFNFTINNTLKNCSACSPASHSSADESQNLQTNYISNNSECNFVSSPVPPSNSCNDTGKNNGCLSPSKNIDLSPATLVSSNSSLDDNGQKRNIVESHVSEQDDFHNNVSEIFENVKSKELCFAEKSEVPVTKVSCDNMTSIEMSPVNEHAAINSESYVSVSNIHSSSSMKIKNTKSFSENTQSSYDLHDDSSNDSDFKGFHPSELHETESRNLFSERDATISHIMEEVSSPSSVNSVNESESINENIDNPPVPEVIYFPTCDDYINENMETVGTDDELACPSREDCIIISDSDEDPKTNPKADVLIVTDSSSEESLDKDRVSCDEKNVEKINKTIYEPVTKINNANDTINHTSTMECTTVQNTENFSNKNKRKNRRKIIKYSTVKRNILAAENNQVSDELNIVSYKASVVESVNVENSILITNNDTTLSKNNGECSELSFLDNIRSSVDVDFKVEKNKEQNSLVIKTSHELQKDTVDEIEYNENDSDNTKVGENSANVGETNENDNQEDVLNLSDKTDTDKEYLNNNLKFSGTDAIDKTVEKDTTIDTVYENDTGKKIQLGIKDTEMSNISIVDNSILDVKLVNAEANDMEMIENIQVTNDLSKSSDTNDTNVVTEYSDVDNSLNVTENCDTVELTDITEKTDSDIEMTEDRDNVKDADGAKSVTENDIKTVSEKKDDCDVHQSIPNVNENDSIAEDKTISLKDTDIDNNINVVGENEKVGMVKNCGDNTNVNGPQNHKNVGILSTAKICVDNIYETNVIESSDTVNIAEVCDSHADNTEIVQTVEISDVAKSNNIAAVSTKNDNSIEVVEQNKNFNDNIHLMNQTEIENTVKEGMTENCDDENSVDVDINIISQTENCNSQDLIFVRTERSEFDKCVMDKSKSNDSHDEHVTEKCDNEDDTESCHSNENFDTTKSDTVEIVGVTKFSDHHENFINIMAENEIGKVISSKLEVVSEDIELGRNVNICKESKNRKLRGVNNTSIILSTAVPDSEIFDCSVKDGVERNSNNQICVNANEKDETSNNEITDQVAKVFIGSFLGAEEVTNVGNSVLHITSHFTEDKRKTSIELSFRKLTEDSEHSEEESWPVVVQSDSDTEILIAITDENCSDSVFVEDEMSYLETNESVSGDSVSPEMPQLEIATEARHHSESDIEMPILDVHAEGIGKVVNMSELNSLSPLRNSNSEGPCLLVTQSQPPISEPLIENDINSAPKSLNFKDKNSPTNWPSVGLENSLVFNDQNSEVNINSISDWPYVEEIVGSETQPLLDSENAISFGSTCSSPYIIGNFEEYPKLSPLPKTPSPDREYDKIMIPTLWKGGTKKSRGRPKKRVADFSNGNKSNDFSVYNSKHLPSWEEICMFSENDKLNRKRSSRKKIRGRRRKETSNKILQHIKTEVNTDDYLHELSSLSNNSDTNVTFEKNIIPKKEIETLNCMEDINDSSIPLESQNMSDNAIKDVNTTSEESSKDASQIPIVLVQKLNVLVKQQIDRMTELSSEIKMHEIENHNPNIPIDGHCLLEAELENLEGSSAANSCNGTNNSGTFYEQLCNQNDELDNLEVAPVNGCADDIATILEENIDETCGTESVVCDQKSVLNCDQILSSDYCDKSKQYTQKATGNDLHNNNDSHNNNIGKENLKNHVPRVIIKRTSAGSEKYESFLCVPDYESRTWQPSVRLCRSKVLDDLARNVLEYGNIRKEIQLSSLRIVVRRRSSLEREREREKLLQENSIKTERLNLETLDNVERTEFDQTSVLKSFQDKPVKNSESVEDEQCNYTVENSTKDTKLILHRQKSIPQIENKTEITKIEQTATGSDLTNKDQLVVARKNSTGNKDSNKTGVKNIKETERHLQQNRSSKKTDVKSTKEKYGTKMKSKLRDDKPNKESLLEYNNVSDEQSDKSEKECVSQLSDKSDKKSSPPLYNKSGKRRSLQVGDKSDKKIDKSYMLVKRHSEGCISDRHRSKKERDEKERKRHHGELSCRSVENSKCSEKESTYICSNVESPTQDLSCSKPKKEKICTEENKLSCTLKRLHDTEDSHRHTNKKRRFEKSDSRSSKSDSKTKHSTSSSDRKSSSKNRHKLSTSNNERKANQNDKHHKVSSREEAVKTEKNDEEDKLVMTGFENGGASRVSSSHDVCCVCGHKYSGKQDRSSHVKQHPNHCTKCHLAFQAQADLEKHLSSKHSHTKEQHHCLLCERSFPTAARHQLHVEGRQHKQLESCQRRTIHTLFKAFTGHESPALPSLTPEEEQGQSWFPNDSGFTHFYYQATPLQLALQDLTWRQREQNTLTDNQHNT